ncbi:MAG: SLC13 family permease [Emergencia timonensis]|uniref:SLC13 family permease n=1 Tax=Emergencia timonensis TaxID=1776384 RepID=UPI0008339F83|nr:SLC13 family permease [Emergencia timonensis]WNX87604.1 SLC13 family permease [Emergencia timonensis]
MNLAVLSLIVFLITVVVGIVRKVNCGLAAILASFVLILFFIPQMDLADLYRLGWPVSTFFMMLSVLLLFGIAGTNGTMEIVAKRILSLAKGRAFLMPFVIYLLSFLLSASGAGPGVAPMIMMIAMGVCKETGLSCFMMGIMVEIGAASGGLSPVATSGIIAKELAKEAGVSGYMGLFLPYAAAMFAEVLLVYFLFGGAKAKTVSSTNLRQSIPQMNLHQKETLAVILFVICAIIFLGLDVSVTAFSGAALLILLGVMEDKKAVSTVNWNTLLLVAGMYMLISVVDQCGGIALISDILLKWITPKSATGIMTLISGLLATVTSSSGVVMPTLIPVGGHIAESLAGVSASSLLSGVIAGANCALFCPFSVLGSMTIALYPEGTDRQMIFKRHLQMTAASIVFFTLLGFSGFLSLFA